VADIDGGPAAAACTRLLSEAFAHEPATAWICGESPAARRNWFAATLRAHGTVPGARRVTLTGAGHVLAAAVLTPPGAVPRPRAQAAWAARVALRCGPGAVRRTVRYVRATEAWAPDDAWTLEFIGVDPRHRGRGAARRLLNHLLADLTGPHPVHLTTADPGNVALYRHFGFAVDHRIRVGPLTTTAMSRR